MNWNDLDGTILLGKVFSKPLKMSMVDVFSVKIERDGPSILIEFDLVGSLPDNPPKKWGNDYNKCRAGINCSGVTQLSFNDVGTRMLANIKIEKVGLLYRVSLNGDNLAISFECGDVRFMGPSVYLSN
ncbi:hypothetical protein HQN64_23480 [Enterobacteriaceae bacterium BIT-l23]|uniref:Imm50 family immunity protein n=1 Tax=Jejubacter sp. L23 TaxID=3092086 RepID=UPI001584E80D|nr:hypothetical protein [Enterobacteriaceae bacterium BIT-l23]